MPVRLEYKEKEITAFISGELDHHTAKSIRADIDAAIDAKSPEKLFLDFRDVTFMDSSGIGLVMGRYKIMQSIGGQVTVCNPPGNIKRVMQVAGLNKIANIK